MSNLELVVRAILEWLRIVGPDVVIIIIVAWISHRLLNKVTGRIIHHSIKPKRFANKRDLKLREDTLHSLARSAIKLIVWLIALLLIFNKLFPSINLAALGASAGILGIVIGIGSQSLIKDFIAGIFVLVENQYRVGDLVILYCPTNTNEVRGKVIQISLRMTVLRGEDGGLNIVPNGSIARSVNLTFDYAQVILHIGLQLDTNLEKVEKLIGSISKEMESDLYWRKKLIKSPSYGGIQSFDKDSVIIAVSCKTAPAEQYVVKSELQSRILSALLKNNIELA